MEEEFDFINWLIENGATVSEKIQFHYFEEGRGIAAIEDIEQDEDLFFIPYDCCIFGDTTTVNDNDAINWIPLMIKIYKELHSDGYQPYLRILPQVDCPMVWNEDEQKLMELISPIGLEDAQLQFQKLNEFVDCSLEDFHYIGCLIMAYSFTFTDIVMIPMADMLNHHTANNAQLYEIEGGFVMKAITPIQAQTQVFNTYGTYANPDLLLKYGFVELDNPNDAIWLDGYFGLGLFPYDDEIEEELEDVEEEQELENFNGLEDFLEDSDVEKERRLSIDLEAATEMKDELEEENPRVAVLEYVDTLDYILAFEEPNPRIGKLQYVAQCHKAILMGWLEAENTTPEDNSLLMQQ